MVNNNFIPLELKVVASLNVDVSKDLKNKESKNINELFYQTNEEKEKEEDNKPETTPENGQTHSI